MREAATHHEWLMGEQSCRTQAARNATALIDWVPEALVGVQVAGDRILWSHDGIQSTDADEAKIIAELSKPLLNPHPITTSNSHPRNFFSSPPKWPTLRKCFSSNLALYWLLPKFPPSPFPMEPNICMKRLICSMKFWSKDAPPFGAPKPGVRWSQVGHK